MLKMFKRNTKCGKLRIRSDYKTTHKKHYELNMTM